MNKKTEFRKEQLRTWIEIDRKAIRHNYKLFRSVIPKKTLLCSVVKSNAYGHGLVDFAQCAKNSVDVLAVDSVVEGIRLREQGIKKPVFVLGYTLPSMYFEAMKNDIAVTVANMSALDDALKLKMKKKLKVHIKIDTGMSRQGFFVKELKEVVEKLQKAKHLDVIGVYTHFADAKNPAFPKNTYEQKNIFEEAVGFIKEAGFNPIVHCSATSTAILFPEMHFDMVRVGIGSYGLWPSKEVKAYAEDFFHLLSVMTWKTVLADVKTLEKGVGVSYGFTERVRKKTKIGILPIGYWHGYARNLSSIGHVLVNGKRARVLGLVTMDMVIVDLSKVGNVKVRDEVVLLGKQGKEEVTADELAYLLNTVNYEVVTRINPKIKRIVT